MAASKTGRAVVFMTALTGRYAYGQETRMEADLAHVRDVTDESGFASVLKTICAAKLTSDFWSISLPTDLATSSAQSPSLFAYFAALNLLDAKVLFSDKKVSDMIDQSTQSTRSKVERHHLFPRGYLKEIGIRNAQQVNQIANFTPMEWGDNVDISDQSPADYVPTLANRFSARDLERMYYWHALPDGWQAMGYHDFLHERRECMARIIRSAYHKLAYGDDSDERSAEPEVQVEDLITTEDKTTEFKSTLRTNMHTGEKDKTMELMVLKTIAAFINSDGGTLVIGVADDGASVGIGADGFPNEDKMHLHLANLVRDRIGAEHALYVHPRFDDREDVRVLTVNV